MSTRLWSGGHGCTCGLQSLCGPHYPPPAQHPPQEGAHLAEGNSLAFCNTWTSSRLWTISRTMYKWGLFVKHDDLRYLAGTLGALHSHQLPLCISILCWLCCWVSPIWNCCPSGDIYILVCWEEVIKWEGTRSPCMAAGSFTMLFSLSDGRGVPALLCGLCAPHPSQLAAPVGL